MVLIPYACQPKVIAKVRFEWDPDKDRENQRKHGIPFGVAQFAFADPKRVIAEDVSHSVDEKRYYCFGDVEGGSLRFDLYFGAK